MLTRDYRIELLAVAPSQDLLNLADRVLKGSEPPTVIAGPEVGLVMMQIREPVCEERFFLGEVLVTRAEVELAGARGWAMRMGEDRVATLAATVEAHELIDPTLSPERLLLRLFHEEGVRVSPALEVAARCRCSRERIHGFLKGFSDADIAEMREPDGGITVTCEFCSTKYKFTGEQIR